jgi:hypothetical protein
MSAFKEAIQKDVENTFINLDEFASVHSLNGVEVPCIIDKDLTKPAQQNLEGVFLNTMTIYVKAADLDSRPVEGEMFKVDGSFHFVHSVSDEEGVYAIVCEANEQ